MSYREIKSAVAVAEEDVQQLQKTVKSILSKVKTDGDSAIRYYEKKFDDFDPPSFRISEEEAAKAGEELPVEVIEELDFAIEQVTAFARAQKDSMVEFEKEIRPGMLMGQRIIPLGSCGCYVPAGRYPCLTSAVMSVIPAKVAGVQRIVACSPPGKGGSINPGILYTMHKMAVDEIYCIGGAQAIGAMAYGTDTIAPVDLIVGPGNQFVMEAKRQVFGTVGIDFLAGPSECLIIADETARADYVAADLLAQCEHDPQARGALVTTSETLARRALEEIERQLRDRTTEAVARASWEDKGVVVVVDNLNDAARYANEYAPEHLEIHTARPREVVPLLKNYGSLFIGEDTAEVYADKIAGPNHILPTGAAARYTGGLWVGMFLKVVTHMEVDRPASLKLAKYAETQGAYEGMDAHRYAAAIRLRNLKE
ncbi:MAG: histidinol dehydrogenase [Desulfobacteraceae bacterium]|jgi:histidinol dehydrogenase|nr:histidinol dehydrogenase [Desulfobacteraceae bacterium]